MRATRIAAALGAAALCSTTAIPAALAAPEYPPTSPTRAAAICIGDIPYFAYEVDFGDDNSVGNSMTITFVNPGGPDSVISTTVPAVGERGVVLWPGASEDPQDWPGWELNDEGEWVETTEDEGAFTRAPGGVEVRFETNPTLTTPVEYPPASEICANPPQETAVSSTSTTPDEPAESSTTTSTPAPTPADTATAAAAAETTPQTGAAPVLPLALGLLALGGGGLLYFFARRRA